MSHSPGPWTYEDGVVYSVPIDEVKMIEGVKGTTVPHHTGLVALVYGHHIGPEHQYTHKANARLIAAAPTMQQFIEEVAGGDCYQYDKHFNPKPCGTCQSCRARALLAKIDEEITDGGDALGPRGRGDQGEDAHG